MQIPAHNTHTHTQGWILNLGWNAPTFHFQPRQKCCVLSIYMLLFTQCTCWSPGPPLPPQEVQVQCGQSPGFLQVRWKPPPLTSSGTSNGASVIGYAVCTKGQKVPDIIILLWPARARCFHLLSEWNSTAISWTNLILQELKKNCSAGLNGAVTGLILLPANRW